MPLISLFEQLKNADVRLWLEGEQLRFSAPASGLPEHLKQRIQQHKAQVIAFLQQSQAALVPALSKVNPTQAQDLSFTQQRIAFVQELLPNSDVFHLPFAFEIQGYLDLSKLEQALNTLVEQHSMLRTAYRHGKQVLVNKEFIPLQVQALEAFPTPQALKDLLQKENSKPFHLDQGEVFRHCLYTINTEHYLLLITMHHIATDYLSLQLIAQQLLEIYQQATAIKTPQWHYQDFAVWQHNIDFSNDLLYWQEQLQDIPPLQLIQTGSEQFNTDAENLSFQLSEQQTQALQSLAKQEKTSIFTVFLALFSTLLYRYSQQNLFAIGTAVSNRQHPELDSVIGCFTNLLAIRCEHAEQQESFLTHLTAIKATHLDALSHQQAPFEQIVRQLGASAYASSTPIFQAMINWQEATTANFSYDVDGLSIQPITIDSYSSNYELSLTLQEWQNHIVGKFQFRVAVFETDFIERLKNSFLLLIDAVINNPSQAISELNILQEQDRQLQLNNWNNTERPRKELDAIHHYIEQQALQNPSHIAVKFADQQLSYLQLNDYADKLAKLIRFETQHDYVAVFCQRSLLLPVVLLAVLKSGKAYLPIDEDTPTQLIHRIFDDAAIDLAICDQKLSKHLPPVNALIIEELNLESAIKSVFPNTPSPAGKLFNLIYTSGSTGAPKGVLMSHKAMINRLLWMQEQFKLQPHESVLHKTSISFDVSIWEVFWPLMQGGCVVLAQPQQQKSAADIAELIEAHHIAFAHFVPSMLGWFIEQANPNLPLRAVIASGETLPHYLSQRFLKKFSTTALYNLYGPTEAAIDVSFHPCQLNEQSTPIGKPIANTQLYICDSHMQLLPIGAIGEIIISGRNLAEGYLNQADNSSFIDHPFIQGERAYRSGDLGFFDQQGNLHFIGRQDSQVKIRGFRIELNAIAHALAQHTDISECHIICHAVAEDDMRIIAFYKSQQPELSPKSLRVFLQNSLPSYMLPNHFVKVRDWPVNKNGKLAESVLLKGLQTNIITNSFTPPNDAIEQVIYEIWAELLAIDNFGIHDNFFSLGGHSLLASQALTKIQQHFVIHIPLVDIFNQPTVAYIAAVVKKQLEQKDLLIDGPLQEGEQELNL